MATIDRLPCGLIRVRIPAIMSWSPGQHIFVRFLALGVHSFTAHPFTICSLYHDPDIVGRAPEIVLCIKPKQGFTGRLAKLVSKSNGVTTTRVLMEGPYGGISSSLSSDSSLSSWITTKQQQEKVNPNSTSAQAPSFDSVLVIAGGSGAGFSQAIIRHTLRRFRVFGTFFSSTIKRADCCCSGDAEEEEKRRPHKLQVVYATRDLVVAKWYMDELKMIMAEYGVTGHEVAASICVTSSSEATGRETAESQAQDVESHSQMDDLALALAKEAETTAAYDNTPINKEGQYRLNSDSSRGEYDHEAKIKEYHQRPHLASIVAEAATSSSALSLNIEDAETQGKAKSTAAKTPTSLTIYSCGPSSMLHDVRNAAAMAQVKIFRNDPDAVDEVALHSESFSYVIFLSFLFCVEYKTNQTDRW